MENKEKVNKNTTKKVSNKEKTVNNNLSRDRVFVIVIALVIIICIVVGYLLLNKNSNNLNNNGNNGGNNGNSGSNVNDDIDAVFENIIDMSKTENVTIADNIKTNNSPKFAEEKKIDNLVVKNVVFTGNGNNGVTVFKAVIENPTDTEVAVGRVVITFLNNDGSEYGTLEGYIDTVPAGGSVDMEAYGGADLVNAYDYTIAKGE